MKNQSPIRDKDELTTALPERVRDQIVYELDLLTSEEQNYRVDIGRGPRRKSQEDVANLFGEEQSYLSKILNHQNNLSVEKAVRVDEAFPEGTSLGVSFLDLVKIREDKIAATQHEAKAVKRRRRAFLASPMAAVIDDYEDVRAGARRVFTALQDIGITPYWAGESIETAAKFEQADVAFDVNLRELRRASHFVLFWEGHPAPVTSKGKSAVRGKPAAISSIWVEAGMALALNIPATFLVPEPDDLPFVLKKALVSASKRGGAPAVVRQVKNSAAAAEMIRANPNLF